MFPKHLLLELQQLHHQAGQGLVGGGLGLDVLGEHTRGPRFKHPPKRKAYKYKH